ncbi:MAG: type IV pilin protein [Aeromonas sp.]
MNKQRMCSHNRPSAASGFTLLELMITVAIVAILASVAAPSYFSYVRDARRDDAKRALLEAAQTMESFYAMNMTYVGAGNGTTPTIFPTKVPKDGSDHYYTLQFAAAPTKVSYTLNAVPVGGQANDRCGTLSLTRAGAKSAAQSDCW